METGLLIHLYHQPISSVWEDPDKLRCVLSGRKLRLRIMFVTPKRDLGSQESQEPVNFVVSDVLLRYTARALTVGSKKPIKVV
jgi:hypothetical protein